MRKRGLDTMEGVPLMYRTGSKKGEPERNHVPKKERQVEQDENEARQAFADEKTTSNWIKSRDTIRGHARS